MTAAATAAAASIYACSSDDEPATARPDAAGADADARTEDVADAARADGPSGPFCQVIDASSLIHCSDFESTTGPLFGFDDRVATGSGSSFSVSEEGGVTHPSRVLDLLFAQTAAGPSEVDGGDAGNAGDASDSDSDGGALFLVKNLPTGKSASSYVRYEVDVDFRVVGTASLAYVALSILSFPTGAIKEHGFAVYDGNVFGRLAPKDFAVKDDESLWHHAHLVVARSGTATTFATTIGIDGTLVDNVGGVNPGTTGTTAVRLGAFATSPDASGAMHAQFDNVVIRRW